MRLEAPRHHEDEVKGAKVQNSINLHPVGFMVLPPEVRLLIYQYIIPSTLVKNDSYERHEDRKPPLRDDFSPCSAALFRTCRQIYKELHREWYRKPVYNVSLAYGSNRFLSSLSLYWITLPPAFLQQSGSAYVLLIGAPGGRRKIQASKCGHCLSLRTQATAGSTSSPWR
jgi:hypothetical protein